MKGQSFKTPEGEIIKVEEFDAINKMAYVHISSGQYRWYTEAEYSEWVSTGTATIAPDFFYVPDIPAQMTEEQAASVEVVEEVVAEKPKKRTTKKKTDAADTE